MGKGIISNLWLSQRDTGFQELRIYFLILNDYNSTLFLLH